MWRVVPHVFFFEFSCHMHWRDKMCHVGMLRNTRKRFACHATPPAQQDLILEKSNSFHTNSDENDFYIKIIALNEIYNFVVLSRLNVDGTDLVIWTCIWA